MTPDIDMPRINWARVITAVVLVVTLFALGAIFGGHLATPAPEVIAHRAAVRQHDGSLIAERAPEAAPAPAPHEIPKGWREERRISATVKPSRADCPPVGLDMSIVADDEGGKRVIVSSQDGEVITAKDIPVDLTAAAPAPKRWAAGVAYALGKGSGERGLWVERELGHGVRVGADLMQASGGELSVVVRAGIDF